MWGSLFTPHPSISLPLSLTFLPSKSRLSPMWTSTIMKKDVLCVCVYVCLTVRTHSRVTCVVMNKDVLCVELVVNHWQCWQLTDKQIDPRPPRERRLAPAHSSHTRIYYTHTYTKLWKGWPEQSGSFLTTRPNTCVRHKVHRESRSKTRVRKADFRATADNICNCPDCSPVNFNLAFDTLSKHAHKNIQTHSCTPRHTEQEIRVLALVIQKSHRGRRNLGAWQTMAGWADGWLERRQDDKTELKTRSSTMWQLSWAHEGVRQLRGW